MQEEIAKMEPHQIIPMSPGVKMKMANRLMEAEES
jgi:hypothetical protein